MEITITFDDKKVQKKISELAKGVKDFRTPMKESGEDLKDFFGNEVFDSQGSSIGEKWRPLSPTTLKLRSSRTGYYKAPPEATNKILVWTGRLHRGFESIVNSLSLRIRNNVNYFKYHQLGGGIPKRPMLAVNSKVIEKVMKRVNDYIITLLK